MEEGKGWSAWQAPTTKTHNTHILVVSKRTHCCSKFLSIKFTTPTPALSKVLKKTKTLYSRARGSTCYQPGRRAQTERSSSDQDLPATTVQLVPKICRPPPVNSSPRSAGTHPPVNSSRCGSSPRTRRRCNTSDPCSSGEKQQAETMDKKMCNIWGDRLLSLWYYLGRFTRKTNVQL